MQDPKPGGLSCFVAPIPGWPGYIKEVDLAKKIGINQAFLRKFRKEKLEPGLDWYHEGRGAKTRVWWTEPGCKKIETALGITVVPDRGNQEELKVVRSGFRNPRVIYCATKAGEVVTVKVKDSKNYTPMLTTGQPMMVWAVKDSDGPCYHAVGRAPRYRGRW